MGDELKALVRLVAAVGLVCALVAAIVVQIRIRMSWSKRPHSFLSRLMFYENTKEHNLFVVLVIIVVVLGHIVVDWN
jgi:hypothetical protein